MLLNVLSLVLNGCQSVAAIEGAGFQKVPLKAASVNYLEENDTVALNKTISNNRTCSKTPACK